MTTTALREVYRADWAWWEIVDRAGRVVVDDESCYDESEFLEACRIAEYDPNDDEVSTTTVTAVSEEDDAIHVGDLVLFGGYGADVVFLRKS